MEIGPLHNEKPLAFSERNRTEKKELAQKQAGRTDSLEISSSSRQKLALMADTVRQKYGISSSAVSTCHESDTSTEIRPDKIEQARTRIETGFYAQHHVKQIIADKLAKKIQNHIQSDET